MLPVPYDPVVNGVQRYQHTDGHELLPQFPDIVTDHTGAGIYIRLMSKGIQTAGYK